MFNLQMKPAGGQQRPLVLMGFAEALSAPEVAWSLADAGFEVCAFGRRGRRSALRQSRYAIVHEVAAPETDTAGSFNELCKLATKLSRERAGASCVLLPLDDASLWLSIQSALPEGWILAGPGKSVARMALDKKFQIESARSAGIQVPETILAATCAEALEAPLTFPLILRPADAALSENGRLQKGRNWICANRNELEKALKSWNGGNRLLMQPFVHGIGEGVFGLATSDGVRAWSGHKRLRMMNPHGSGSSACISQPVPKNLLGPIERMVLSAGWRGLFMVEMLQDKAGGHWFVEFNGRPWGSMALSRRQGFEYPAWHVNQALNPGWKLPETNTRNAQVVCRNLGREIMHLLFVLKGSKSAAIQDWPPFWRSMAGVMFVSPRDSFYNFRRDDLKVFVSDCICTMRDQLFKPKRPVSAP